MLLWTITACLRDDTRSNIDEFLLSISTETRTTIFFSYAFWREKRFGMESTDSSGWNNLSTSTVTRTKGLVKKKKKNQIKN